MSTKDTAGCDNYFDTVHDKTHTEYNGTVVFSYEGLEYTFAALPIDPVGHLDCQHVLHLEQASTFGLENQAVVISYSDVPVGWRMFFHHLSGPFLDFFYEDENGVLHEAMPLEVIGDNPNNNPTWLSSEPPKTMSLILLRPEYGPKAGQLVWCKYVL